MNSKIEKQLQIFTKISRASKEDYQAYLSRLAHKALTLPDTTWEELNVLTQEWVNDALTAQDTNKPIPSFPDEDMSADKPSLSPEELAALDDLAKKLEPSKKGVKQVTSAGVPVAEIARKVIISYPEASIKEVMAMLTTSGVLITQPSLHVLYYNTRAVMNFLHTAGILDKLEAAEKLKATMGV